MRFQIVARLQPSCWAGAARRRRVSRRGSMRRLSSRTVYVRLSVSHVALPFPTGANRTPGAGRGLVAGGSEPASGPAVLALSGQVALAVAPVPGQDPAAVAAGR